MNDDKLLRKAKRYIEVLRDFTGELDYSLGKLEDSLNNYLSKKDKISKIDLLSSVSLFEQYFSPLIENYKQYSLDDNGRLEKNIYVLNIERHWRAYEFKELFNSIDYYHKIYALKQKLLHNMPEYRPFDTRYFYYRYALLHHYLFFREELTVKKIEYASPGNINFEGLGEVIRELRETVDWIISAKWIENIIAEFTLIKHKEYRKLLSEKKYIKLKADYESEKNRLLEEKIRSLKNKNEIAKYSSLKKAVRKTKEELKATNPLEFEKNEEYLNRIENISDIGVELEYKKIASLPEYEDKVISNAKNLNRLGFKNKKIRPYK